MAKEVIKKSEEVIIEELHCEGNLKEAIEKGKVSIFNYRNVTKEIPEIPLEKGYALYEVELGIEHAKVIVEINHNDEYDRELFSLIRRKGEIK